MKFQKYLREVAGHGPRHLQHVDYKMLKGEVKDLRAEIEAGVLSFADAHARFTAALRCELYIVGDSLSRQVALLGTRVEVFSSCIEAFVRDGPAYDFEALRSVALLAPLQPWLELAAWADALQRHRLLQAVTVVKIIKKFVKMISFSRRLTVTPRGVRAPAGVGAAGCADTSRHSGGADERPPDAAALLRQGGLRGDELQALCRRLDSAGDAMLRAGLAADGGESWPEEADPCAVCLGGVADPVRLPCGHRFCVLCVLPLFNAREGRAAGAAHGERDAEAPCAGACVASEASACSCVGVGVGSGTDACARDEGATGACAHVGADAEPDAAFLRCPLCRAAGPAAPRALRLDGLLPRMRRGLAMCGDDGHAEAAAAEERRFTAVIVSSLARLAAPEGSSSASEANVAGRLGAGQVCPGGGERPTPRVENFVTSKTTKHQQMPPMAPDASTCEVAVR